MIEIAPNVFQIPVMPRQMINAYLIGSVLIDAGINRSANKILKAIGSRKLTAHALTHAHPDHQGASAIICQKLGIPYWVGVGDKATAESGDIAATMINPKQFIVQFEQKYFAGKGHPVARALKEGDLVEGFRVIETPGHSAGHLSFWRESDGVLIVGDVLRNLNFGTTFPELGEPIPMFTPNIPQNRASIKKLAALQPKVACFGHGPALRDPQRIAAFAKGLG